MKSYLSFSRYFYLNTILDTIKINYKSVESNHIIFNIVNILT